MKKIFLFLIIIISVVLAYYSLTLNKKTESLDLSEDIPIPFYVDKIVFYSGILPKSTSFYDNNNWNLSISQYTDIAIYLANNSRDLDDSNTIHSLYIDNIKYEKKPNIGFPSLYYQNPLQFASDNIYSDYIIKNHLSYNILNFSNEENYDYYSTPNFFTDCSLPITLKYVNSDILKNYKIANTETLSFDGQILKNSNINLNDLKTNISFYINIVSNDGNLYQYKANISPEFQTSETNLFNQNITYEQSIKQAFSKVKKN